MLLSETQNVVHACNRGKSVSFILCRYNNFQHDELSRCNCTPPYSGENAISARSDLNPANGTYPFSALGHRVHGGTDMKVKLCLAMAQLNVYFILLHL